MDGKKAEKKMENGWEKKWKKVEIKLKKGEKR